MPSALILAPLILAVVLAISGGAKLARPGTTLEGMRSLALPRWLTGRLVVRAFPVVEIVLAAVLVVGTGWVVQLAALAALVLFAAYWIVILRAVRSGGESHCACFGALTEDSVSARTVARNSVFLALAAVAVVYTLGGGTVLQRLTTMPGADWWWLLGALVTAASASLALGRGAPRRTSTAPSTSGGPDDYIRFPIPFGVLRDRQGQDRTLRELATSSARLLVFVSLGCSSCESILEQIPAWSRALAPVALHPVVWAESDQFAQECPELADAVLFDQGVGVARLFDLTAQPAAVLLGADGLLAGGPVTGAADIANLVQDMTAQLHHAAVD